MELIKEFTVGLVIVCIIGAVILILAPEGLLEKQVKTSVSLVMLLCFIYPFSSGVELDFDFEVPIETDIKMSADELFTDMLKSKLIFEIKNFLSKNGVESEKIEVVMHTSAESEISIESVTVYIPTEYSEKTDFVQRLIKDKFGMVSRIEVLYESENQ